MLKALKIEGYALIDSMEVEWNEGLTALTGETGSGKSIVLGALGLALGERADASVIRTGATKCMVEARFRSDVANWLVAHDFDVDEDLVIRREVTTKGRSRAFINDTPTSVAELKVLGQLLVDLHGQDETRALGDRVRRIELMDAMGDHAPQVERYVASYRAWQERLEERRKLVQRAKSPEGDLDYLTYQCQEIAALALTGKDVDALHEEWNVLQHAASIRAELLESAEALSSDRSEVDAIAALGMAVKFLGRAGHHHPAAAELAERMEHLRSELAELHRDIETESERVQEDPERELELQQWLDEYQRVLSKHRLNHATELLEKEAEMNQAIAEAEHHAERLEAIDSEVAAAYEEVVQRGEALRKSRTVAALSWVDQVMEQLQALKMKDAAIEVVWTPLETPDAWGLDEVEWHFRSHPTSSFQPLTQVASGGERSRLMLAIKAVQGNHSPVPTIILDEIDTGVSGHVAECMAKMMREMARGQQVISVTHLPQVAGAADHHLRVSKHTTSDRVNTVVTPLSLSDRVEELASMLSGARITDAAREHAQSLLAEGK